MSGSVNKFKEYTLICPRMNHQETLHISVLDVGARLIKTLLTFVSALELRFVDSCLNFPASDVIPLLTRTNCFALIPKYLSPWRKYWWKAVWTAQQTN